MGPHAHPAELTAWRGRQRRSCGTFSMAAPTRVVVGLTVPSWLALWVRNNRGDCEAQFAGGEGQRGYPLGVIDPRAG